jgi:Tol biopolymer transport system component
VEVFSMAPDVLDRLRAADPAARMPEQEPAERERLRRVILATPPEPPRPRRRWRPTGRTLVVLLGGAVLLAGGTVYAARLVGGNQSETSSVIVPTSKSLDRIAFTKLSGYPGWGPIDIVSIDSKGRELRRLARHSWAPAYSPDGSKIAYVHSHLWVMNADGSNKRELTDHPVAMPAWSPDGKQIVFVDGHIGFYNEEEGPLFVVNADGSGLRPLSPDEVDGKDPAWAPDGRIFFDRSSEKDQGDISSADFGRAQPVLGEICSVDPDGSDLEIVTAAPTPTSFSLSPDGKWLLVWDSSADRLVRLLASGQGIEVVVVEKLSRLFWRFPHSKATDVESSWSPDGSRIAFACSSTGHTDGDWDWSGLYIVKADGSGLKKVPDSGRIPRATGRRPTPMDPVWQPQQ